jgi:hypothetical protein
MVKALRPLELSLDGSPLRNDRCGRRLGTHGQADVLPHLYFAPAMHVHSENLYPTYQHLDRVVVIAE